MSSAIPTTSATARMARWSARPLRAIRPTSPFRQQAVLNGHCSRAQQTAVKRPMSRITGASMVDIRACTMAVTITRTRITVRSTSTTTTRRTRTTTSAVASLLSHRLTLHLVVGVPHPFYIARLTAQHLLKKSRQDTA